MCGIAGLFRPGGVDLGPLQAMTRSLARRGPDAEEIEIIRDADGHPFAGLGVRRLAIVDPEGGRQPVSDPQGLGWWVALNGEIYNHARVRGELDEGVEPRSSGDTEVVAALLASRRPIPALERLAGMFAIAAVDTRGERLLLARDRMGVKPLYWTRLPDGTVAFASELKGLLTHPELGRRIDPVALQSLLLFEYVPGPRTIYEGIHALPPGTLLEVDRAGIREQRWWTPPVPQPPRGGSLAKWAQSLYGSLQVATGQRLKADVEVGLLLSGGVDSASVAAIGQARSHGTLRSFSVAIEAPGFDEGAEARLTAAALGTAHQELRFGVEQLEPTLDEIALQLDEPMADSSLVVTWALMNMVREAGLSCVLSGDGADESLAGYPTCRAHQLVQGMGPLDRLARPALRGLVDRMGVGHEGVTRDYMARRFLDGLGQPWARRHQIWMGAWLPAEIGASEAVWAAVDAHGLAAEATDPASRSMYLDQRMYLADGVLVKVDRASMAHGIEVRSPFLDHHLVELCADMPLDMKLRRGRNKVALREAMKGILPPEVAERKKKGFGTPVGPWLKGPLTHLLDGRPEQTEGLLPTDRLRSSIAEHRAGTADHRRRLWSALVLARWRSGPWGPGA